MYPSDFVIIMCCKQAWLRKAAEREVCETKAVALNELLQDTARAFVGVHTAAMLHLVAGEQEEHVPLQADTVPETLTLDLHCLSGSRLEFKTLEAAMCMLVTSAHELNKDAPVLLTRIAEEVSVALMQQEVPY
jgi:hypothetical protein